MSLLVTLESQVETDVWGPLREDPCAHYPVEVEEEVTEQAVAALGDWAQDPSFNPKNKGKLRIKGKR